MCAFMYHTILVKDKYKMACNNCFFFQLTLHRNNGHQAKLKLYLKLAYIITFNARLGVDTSSQSKHKVFTA